MQVETQFAMERRDAFRRSFYLTHLVISVNTCSPIDNIAWKQYEMVLLVVSRDIRQIIVLSNRLLKNLKCINWRR